MNFVSFSNKVVFFGLVFLFFSCDRDFSPIGSEIVGNENLNIKSLNLDVVAYNRATNAVQTNGLPLNSLGVIENPVFGKTVISYVTQLRLPTESNPTQNIASPTITRVELTIPYFSTLESIDDNQIEIYKLDSLYGKADNKFKLNIYESGYYLRDFDPDTNFEERQKYYSDLYNDINSVKKPNRLNNSSNKAQNDQFFFDKTRQVIYETNENGEQVVKESKAPEMKIELDKEFFKTKIFNAFPGELDNNNTFANYFRGLFFQVEDLGAGSQMMQLNFSQGKITIYYTTPTNQEEQTIVLNLGGNSVSLVQNQFSSNNYTNALSSANPTTGDEKLYLKGSEGSVAYIDLFTDQNELENLRGLVENENWLINEANLVFYIDKSQMDNLHPFVPQRIFLFDAENGIPLADYYFDNSTIQNFPKLSKWVHDGFISNQGSNDNRGYQYKVRITKHITNLLKNSDAKNVKIGVSLTETIANIAMATLKDGIGLPKTSPYRHVPASSVMSPLGVVLYGNNTSDEKKLKLEIRYTKL